jgi:hypothetical protein
MGSRNREIIVKNKMSAEVPVNLMKKNQVSFFPDDGRDVAMPNTLHDQLDMRYCKYSHLEPYRLPTISKIQFYEDSLYSKPLVYHILWS